MLYWPELSVLCELSVHSGHLLILWCRERCVCVCFQYSPSSFYIKTHTPGMQATDVLLHFCYHILCKCAAVMLLGDKHAVL